MGTRLKRRKPLTDAEIDRLPKLIKPHFGKVSFVPPPSYRAFLKEIGPLALEVDEGEDGDHDWCEWDRIFGIYTPKQVAEITSEVVHVPEDVSYDEDKYITTNHLIGFAATDSSLDCTWCFYTDEKRGKDEYPIVFHDQDEPLASKYQETGELVHGKKLLAKVLKHDSFGEFFTDYVAKLVKKDIADEY
jgi:hypothetical protein